MRFLDKDLIESLESYAKLKNYEYFSTTEYNKWDKKLQVLKHSLADSVLGIKHLELLALRVGVKGNILMKSWLKI